MPGYSIPAASTVTLTANSNNVVVSGSDWNLLGIKANDTLRVKGRSVTIGAVPDTGNPQLLLPWPDATVPSASYEVFPDIDAVTFSSDSRQFLAMASGTMSAGKLTDTTGTILNPDCYVGLYVKGNGTNTPPSAPFLLDAYIVGPTPTGAWSSYARKIAVFFAGAWRFYNPFNGMMAFDATANTAIVWQNSAWQPAVVGNGSWITKDTQAHLYADLAHDTNTMCLVFADGANNGFYAKVGASGSGSWTQTGYVFQNVIGLANLGADVIGMWSGETSRAQTIEALIRLAISTGAYNASLSRTATGAFPFSLSYYDWAQAVDGGVDIPAGTVIDALSASISVPSSTATIRVNLWSRPTTSTNINVGPGAAGDTLLQTVNVTPAVAGIAPGNTSVAAALLALQSPVIVAAGVTYIVEINALDASSGVLAMGIGNSSSSDSRQRYRGWFRTPSAPTIWQNVGAAVTSISYMTIALINGPLLNSLGSLLTTGTSSNVARNTSPAGGGLTTKGGFAGYLDAGTDLPVGFKMTAMTFPLVGIASTATNVYCVLRRRLMSAADANAAPGGASSDTVLETWTSTVAAAGLVANGSTRTTLGVTFASGHMIEAGYSYGIEIYATSSGGSRVDIGWGYVATSFSDARRQFWYLNAPSGGAWTISPTSSLAFTATMVKSFVASDDFFVALQTYVNSIGTALNALAATAVGVTSTYTRGNTSLGGVATNHAGYCTYVDGNSELTVGAQIKSVSFPNFCAGTGATTIFVNLRRRSTAGADLNAAPGAAASDTILETWTSTTTAAGVTADGSARSTVTAVFAGSYIIQAGYSYGFEIYATDGGGNRISIGWGFTTITTTEARKLFWYVNALSGGSWASIAGYTPAFVVTTFLSSVAQDSAFKALQATVAGLGSSGTGSAQTLIRQPGCVAAYGFLNRAELTFDNTTPKTFRAILSPPQHYDAVQVILFHGGNSTLNCSGVRVGALASASGGTYDCSGVSFTRGTIGGANSGTIPASAGSFVWGVMVTDKILCKSLTRTDYPTRRPLIVIDAEISNAQNIVVLGKSDGTTDLTNWASRTDYPRLYRYNDGMSISGSASFTSATNRKSATVIGGAIFYFRGQAVGYSLFGDSRTNGEGTATYAGEDAAVLAAAKLNSSGGLVATGVAHSTLNCGWSGVTTSIILSQMKAVHAAAILADVNIFPVQSPNNYPSGTITSNMIDLAHLDTRAMIEESEAHGVKVILKTCYPTNTAVKTWGSSDSLQRAENDQWRLWASRGYVVADEFAIMSGGDDGTGQHKINPSYSTDGIHANDAGKAALEPVNEHAMSALAIARTGTLIAA